MPRLARGIGEAEWWERVRRLKGNVVSQETRPEQDDAQAAHQREERRCATIALVGEVGIFEAEEECQREPENRRGGRQSQLRCLGGRLPEELDAEPEDEEE